MPRWNWDRVDFERILESCFAIILNLTRVESPRDSSKVVRFHVHFITAAVHMVTRADEVWDYVKSVYPGFILFCGSIAFIELSSAYTGGLGEGGGLLG